MKQLLIAACVCTLTATVARAAETSMRYDTDRTRVAHGDGGNNDRYWMAYGANEVNFSFFGTGTVGEETLDRVSADKVERDGKLGLGLGLSYFFIRHLGVEGYAYSESTGGDHFVDNVGGNLIGRLPIGNSGFAPYIFGGAGRQLDPVIQWTWDAGGGIEWRFAPHVGIFVDAQYVWADDTKDYGLGRLGIKVGF